MQTLFIWIGLVAAAGILALARRRRPLLDAWPAYAFSLPVSARLSVLIQNLSGPGVASVHEFAVLLQELAFVTFVGLLVVLFAIRSPVSGPQAPRTQAFVALLGTFIVNVVGFLPGESSSSTVNVLISSAFLFTGTGFAIWSLAVLGRCFGIFPEVRGLVQRGPYRWVRHPVYLGEMVAAVGILMVRPHPLTLALLMVFGALQYWRTIFEERALTAAYPGEYPAYRALVPRLVPGFQTLTRARVSQPAVG